MRRIATVGIIPALALGLLSCTLDPITEEDNTADDEATLVDADRDFYGTYRAFAVAPGRMPLLVLMQDGTYHRSILTYCPTTAPCVPAQDDGKFLIRHRDTKSYLVLFSDTGGVAQYEYVGLGDTMRLRQMDQRQFVTLTRTPDAAWCGERNDCSLQNLHEPSCAGLWMCGASTCNYACMAQPVLDPKPIFDPDPTQSPEL